MWRYCKTYKHSSVADQRSRVALDVSFELSVRMVASLNPAEDKFFILNFSLAYRSPQLGEALPC